MRIFVSSTTYDLLDIRAEVEAHLRSLGFIPVMSDRRQAEFEVHHAANSIETCLINLRTSEVVIVILDKRYGPSLKSSGFDDLSATHIEYREAVAAGRPIYFYVRDRLLADYGLWRHEENPEKRSKLPYSWIRGEANQRLFDFLHERQRLEAGSKQNNWVMSFSDSLQLKEMVSRDLAVRSGRIRLEDALKNARLPTLKSKLRTRQRGTTVFLDFALENIGMTPAIDALWEMRGTSGSVFPPFVSTEAWLAPGDETHILVKMTEEMCHGQFDVEVRYRSTEGFHVKDTFIVEFSNLNLVLSLEYRNQPIVLANRMFAPASPHDDPVFNILDSLD